MKLEARKGATSFSLIKASLLKMGCPHASSTYKIHSSIERRLLTHLYLCLSHLNINIKSMNINSDNFADCVNPLSPCSIKTETTLHFFQYCCNFLNRRKLFDKIKLLDETLL